MPGGRWRARAGTALLALVSLLAALGLCEGFFTLLLDRPALLRSLPENLRRHLRNYYLAFDRDLVHADPACARYDPQLTYTLKPPGCRFANREFAVDLRVNSQGLRDSEAALERPDLIVLGDSFAMGWGVRQEAAFPQRLAALTGLKTLNAAVPSYGTARELALLERLDTSQLRFLVVQYDDNDYWENQALERHGGKLPIRTREQYEATSRRHQRDRSYFPGKHTLEIVRGSLWPGAVPGEAPVPDARQEVRAFVYALQSSERVRRGGFDLVVLELNPAGRPDADFPAALRAAVKEPGLPEAVARLQVLDLDRVVRPEHYFDLDDHLRESGHEQVAREVVKELARVGVERHD